jgi:hypothetical protein
MNVANIPKISLAPHCPNITTAYVLNLSREYDHKLTLRLWRLTIVFFSAVVVQNVGLNKMVR